MYLVFYAPLVDGEMDEDLCFCRQAISCKWIDPDSGEEVEAYAMPDPSLIPAEDVTVTELDLTAATDLAQRCKDRAEQTKGGEWAYKVEAEEQ